MTGLRNVEHDEVLVAVVEVAGIPLVEVVGELRLAVALSFDPAVLVADTESIAIEHHAENAGSLDDVAVAALEVNFAGARERIVETGGLPVRNRFGIGERQILHVEVVCRIVEIHAGGLLELGEHDYVEHIGRRKPLLAADVEQGGDFLESIDIQPHHIGSEAEERFAGDGLFGGETRAELLVVEIEEIDRPVAGFAAVRASGIQVEHGIRGEGIDGPHNEGVVFDGDALIDLVEHHGEEGVQFSRTGKGGLQLAVEDRLIDLEGDHIIIELRVRRSALIHEGIVGSAVGELPRFVDGSLRKFTPDLHKNGAVLPSIHEHAGGGAGIGTIDKNSLADAIDERADKLILPVVEILDGFAHRNHVGQVLLDDPGLTKDLGGNGVDEVVDLCYFHVAIFLSYSSGARLTIVTLSLLSMKT